MSQSYGVPNDPESIATIQLGRGEDVVPIPGSKRRTYLEQNAAAADLALDAAEAAQLDAALPPTAGPRYNERQMAEIDR